MNILIITVLLVVFPAIIKATDPVSLEVFPYAYFQGGPRTFNIQSCEYFSWIGKQIASVKLHGGTCAKLYKSNSCMKDEGCNGEICHLAYPKVQEPILSKELFHNLNSAQACATTTSTIICPKGTWVRRMDFGDDSLRSGITIRCYEPGSRTPNVTLNTHGKHLTTYSSQNCQGAARGVRVFKNTTYNFIPKAEALCNYSSSIGPDSRQCNKTDALVGITVIIEELSNVIKEIQPICRFVENPAKLCTPADGYEPVVVCDNRLGFTSTTCQYGVTEGVGITKTLTDKQSLSLNFYGEFGIGAGASAGDALKATFAAKLGFSKTTDFDWSQSSSSTWTEQTSVQVSIQTPPGVITRLEQVIGKCSFYEVDVNYFKRIDTRGNGTSTSLLVASHEMLKQK
ncbi:unnamed protein product [Allacma fusca]|uniref:Uncharacterized protein n=1 Tax=Allacma fusca TaxID=39272 RepID=A0A8J2J2B1_9HEXA|nr:unnamed protein product [Allacma fusca]